MTDARQRPTPRNPSNRQPAPRGGTSRIARLTWTKCLVMLAASAGVLVVCAPLVRTVADQLSAATGQRIGLGRPRPRRTQARPQRPSLSPRRLRQIEAIEGALRSPVPMPPPPYDPDNELYDVLAGYDVTITPAKRFDLALGERFALRKARLGPLEGDLLAGTAAAWEAEDLGRLLPVFEWADRRIAEGRQRREVDWVMRQIAVDAPQGYLVLWAARRIRAAGADRQASGAAAAFERDWLAAVHDQPNSILPRGIQPVLCRASHDEAVASLLSVGVIGTACAAVGAWVAALLLAYLATRAVCGRDQPPVTLGHRRGAWGWVVCGVMGVAVAAVWTQGSPGPTTNWAWCFSLPYVIARGQAMIVWLLGMLVLLGGRYVESPSDPPPASRRWAGLVWLAAMLLVGAGAMLIPLDRKPWQPPPGWLRLQAAATGWTAIGVIAVLVLLIRWIVGLAAGRGKAMARRLKATTVVACWVGLLLSALLAGGLALNRSAYRRHTEAIAAALHDETAARLGRGWRDRYFSLPERPEEPDTAASVSRSRDAIASDNR